MFKLSQVMILALVASAVLCAVADPIPELEGHKVLSVPRDIFGNVVNSVRSVGRSFLNHLGLSKQNPKEQQSETKVDQSVEGDDSKSGEVDPSTDNQTEDVEEQSDESSSEKTQEKPDDKDSADAEQSDDSGVEKNVEENSDTKENEKSEEKPENKAEEKTDDKDDKKEEKSKDQ